MKWYDEVSAWMDAHKEEMIGDIGTLISYPSVSDPEEGNGPFGQACKDVLDAALEMGRKYGFTTENHEYYVGSIGNEKKNWENTIGFWNHLDVVPVSGDWNFPPFELTRKGRYIIGRGVGDNKGPAVGMLYVMRCVRDLQIPLKHELCLFVGCDEEKGMRDMEYYTSHYPCPAMSMISDTGFPVCYGEKGILEGWITADVPFSEDIVEITSGTASNIIPDEAVLVMKRSALSDEKISALREKLTVEEDGELVRLIAGGISGHSAFPQGSVNAIFNLCAAVCETASVRGSDMLTMEALRSATSGYFGEVSGIAYEDEVSGKLTCAGTVLRMENGRAKLTFNIRYSVTADAAFVNQKLSTYWKDWGFTWEMERDSAPNYFDPSHPAVGILTNLYNEMTNQESKPYVMGGGTYARKLPNAFAYGTGNMPGEDGEEHAEIYHDGRGNAHGLDEALNVDKLTEALKLYIMALIALNDVELKQN